MWSSIRDVEFHTWSSIRDVEFYNRCGVPKDMGGFYNRCGVPYMEFQKICGVL
jgi:hypothetical protein